MQEITSEKLSRSTKKTWNELSLWIIHKACGQSNAIRCRDQWEKLLCGITHEEICLSFWKILPCLAIGYYSVSWKPSATDAYLHRMCTRRCDLQGIMFSLTIVVSFHGTFVTKVDRAFRCMCFFRNIKRLTSGIDMSPIGTTELLDTAKMPTCSYSIHAGTPNGPPVVYVLWKTFVIKANPKCSNEPKSLLRINW